ncbi:MAG: DUF3795 domain-containing protein [Promethearchaeota archaeon]|jgi:hypothetical protein
MVENNLAAPCGIYCGACRQYLLWKKDLLEERGYKTGCKGCRIRNKNCAFIRRDCHALKKKELDYCYECEQFPCQKLQIIDSQYQERWSVNLVENLKRNDEIGVEKWLQEQKELYTCPECGGEICIHDTECYDCGKKINPNEVE